MNSCILTRKDIVEKIDQCISGLLTKEDLENWADHFELNENFEYESKYEKIIADVLFHLSSPDINGDLTVERLLEEKKMLQ
jgi:hypothetical protein